MFIVDFFIKLSLINSQRYKNWNKIYELDFEIFKETKWEENEFNFDLEAVFYIKFKKVDWMC